LDYWPQFERVTRSFLARPSTASPRRLGAIMKTACRRALLAGCDRTSGTTGWPNDAAVNDIRSLVDFSVGYSTDERSIAVHAAATAWFRKRTMADRRDNRQRRWFHSFASSRVIGVKNSTPMSNDFSG
jgi:hypothetical protein